MYHSLINSLLRIIWYCSCLKFRNSDYLFKFVLNYFSIKFTYLACTKIHTTKRSGTFEDIKGIIIREIW